MLMLLLMLLMFSELQIDELGWMKTIWCVLVLV